MCQILFVAPRGASAGYPTVRQAIQPHAERVLHDTFVEDGGDKLGEDEIGCFVVSEVVVGLGAGASKQRG